MQTNVGCSRKVARHGSESWWWRERLWSYAASTTTLGKLRYHKQAPWNAHSVVVGTVRFVDDETAEEAQPTLAGPQRVVVVLLGVPWLMASFAPRQTGAQIHASLSLHNQIEKHVVY